jgi:hypothetical protein
MAINTKYTFIVQGEPLGVLPFTPIATSLDTRPNLGEEYTIPDHGTFKVLEIKDKGSIVVSRISFWNTNN